jgi:alpha-beta hydrolase superfamily lysophospholipase
MGQPLPTRRLRLLIALLCYAVILFIAARSTYSLSGWLVLGLAPALLLDRHVFRLLPWPEPVRLVPALLVRVTFFIGGAVVGYRMTWGMVAVTEAAYVGLVVSLALFLLELAMELAVCLCDRLAGTGPPKSAFRVRNICAMAAFVPVVVFLSPLSVFHPIGLTPQVTPKELGLDFENVRVRTADGLELVGWLVPHERPRGTVIFGHGHGGGRQQSVLVLRQLHDLGLNVLTCDFRGLGQSPGHTATFGLREKRDLMAAESYLLERFQGQPIFVLGISYGAGVALQALPEMKHVRAAWIESGFSRLSDIARKNFEYMPDDFREPLIRTYSTIVWLDTGCWPTEANPIDALGQIHIPILFCHGKDDDLIPFTQGQALYDRYGGPKSCYWLDGAGHDNVQPVGGEEYRRRLREFFEQQLTESSIR